tara:strand:+ start:140 stop:682 length:543 start_codon:yes stop_codon:yes gene_type:complete
MNIGICRKLSIFIIGFSFSAFLSACADETRTTWVDHCEWYDEFRPISKILLSSHIFEMTMPSSGDFAGPQDIQLIKSYYDGALLPELFQFFLTERDDRKIADRVAIHSSPKFLLDQISKPSTYFYISTEGGECRAIPFAQKNQRYIVGFSDGKVSMFEPYSEALEAWVIYYAASRGMSVK